MPSAIFYKKGFGLYIIAFNNLDVDELTFAANSLSDLLLYDIGVDVVVNA